MKELKKILPDYQHIPHLPFKPNVAKGDNIATFEEASIIFHNNRAIEVLEKIDGAFAAMALYNGEPLIRNRDHILRKGYVKATPAKQQFLPVWGWFYENKSKFEKLNEIAGPVGIYGEWTLATHGMKYNRLPDWFIAYDIYNYEEGKFLEGIKARVLLDKAGFNFVPILYYGKIFNYEQLENMSYQPSAFSSTEKCEGIVVKVPTPDNDWTLTRFKMVRSGFVQGALWDKKKLNKNRLLVSES